MKHVSWYERWIVICWPAAMFRKTWSISEYSVSSVPLLFSSVVNSR
jgi:hypothetical protein